MAALCVSVCPFGCSLTVLGQAFKTTSVADRSVKLCFHSRREKSVFNIAIAGCLFVKSLASLLTRLCFARN